MREVILKNEEERQKNRGKRASENRNERRRKNGKKKNTRNEILKERGCRELIKMRPEEMETRKERWGRFS